MMRAFIQKSACSALLLGASLSLAGGQTVQSNQTRKAEQPATKAKAETAAKPQTKAGEERANSNASAAQQQNGGAAASNASNRASDQPAAENNQQVTHRTTMKPAGYRQELVDPIPTDPRHPNYYEPTARTIVRHQSLPSRYNPANANFGYRNPGGVGRFGEFMPPGDEFQNPGRARVASTFSGTNGVVSRDQQIQMAAVGNAQNQTMFNHMAAYSRPMGFYGFGYNGGLLY